MTETPTPSPADPSPPIPQSSQVAETSHPTSPTAPALAPPIAPIPALASTKPKAAGKSFAEIAAQQPEPGLAAELLDFLRHNQKWWLLPILIMLGLFGALVIISSTSVAPFIYTLF